MLLNCDIGERGSDNEIDKKLMQYIDIANIACGGHAGDIASIKTFTELANKHNVSVSAHLSYPDKYNFGRTSEYCGIPELMESLDTQYSLMANVKMIKFHGGLYNDSVTNKEIASHLVNWLISNDIKCVICPDDSELSKQLREVKANIIILREAFAERNYTYNTSTNQLSLVNRSMPHASIHELNDAIIHCDNIINGYVIADCDSDPKHKIHLELNAHTICIHSDSAIALDLAKQLSIKCSK